MGKVVQFAKDTLMSFVGNLGVAGKDKAASVGYYMQPMTDEELSNAYRSSWIARKLIDVPAHDTFRAWRKWQGEAEAIEALENEEKRLNVALKLRQAMTAARLFGGAALYIGTGDTDPSQPLDPKRIKQGGIRYLTVMLRRQLAAGDFELDPENELYGKPKFYTLAAGNRAGVNIHPSRLVIFKGSELPDDELQVSAAGRGWGDSVLQTTLQAIKNADSTAGNIASLVFEAQVDIIKVPDLMASLADDTSKQRLIERFTLGKMLKGVNGMLMLDMEEEYEQKTATFATLPDVLDRFLQIVSGAADIPATRLLGQSPAGMSATGESDLRNYYDRISAGQETDVRPAIAILDECLIYSALGTRDPALHYVWGSLWQISDKERAEIGTHYAGIIEKLNNTGLFPGEALGKAAVNVLTENGVMPGLESEVEDAGGIDAHLEEAKRIEAENAELDLETKRAALQVTDATPRTLYVSRPVLNASEIIKWAKAQGFETTMAAPELHVTIAYSRDPVDWMKVGNVSTWGEDDNGEIHIRPGGVRLVEQFGRATVLLFVNNALAWRHEDIKQAGASWDHDEYQPHITITWEKPQALDIARIEPYRGKIVLGPEIFAEVKEGWSSTVKEA